MLNKILGAVLLVLSIATYLTINQKNKEIAKLNEVISNTQAVIETERMKLTHRQEEIDNLTQTLKEKQSVVTKVVYKLKTDTTQMSCQQSTDYLLDYSLQHSQAVPQ